LHEKPPQYVHASLLTGRLFCWEHKRALGKEIPPKITSPQDASRIHIEKTSLLTKIVFVDFEFLERRHRKMKNKFHRQYPLRQNNQLRVTEGGHYEKKHR
jgi:hypothetical protein